MEQSIKNLLLWLLTLATFLTMHANTVGEEQGHAQNAPMQPEDVRRQSEKRIIKPSEDQKKE
jgi:hypothetical protein